MTVPANNPGSAPILTADEVTVLHGATKTSVDAVTAKLELVRLLLVQIGGYEDGVEGFLDGVEGLLTSLGTSMTTQNGYLDGLEGKLDQMIALLGTADPAFVSSNTDRVSTAFAARPATTPTYASGQLILLGGAPLTFAGAGRVNGGTGTITAGSLISQSVRGGLDVIRLHVCQNLPVITGADASVFATAVALRAAGHFGSIDTTLDLVGNDGTLGHAPPRGRGSIVFKCASNSTSIYGLLEARSAIAGVSGEMIAAGLELIRD
ncbi:MAG TPA: hypothetical protein VF638_14305 [Sphingomonas sp.]|jgi:hypothetical protein